MNNDNCNFNDNFNSDYADTELNIQGIMSKHYCNRTDYKGSGNKIYNVSRKLARFLLHKLRHQLPRSEEEVKELFKFSNILSKEGIKNNWPKQAITIDTKSCTITNGSDLILALALGKSQGTYLPMEVV